jgi:hypothetical protein
MTSGPWTVPDQVTSRRIILQLRHGWRFVRSDDSADGLWHGTKGDLDLKAITLESVVTEAEDHELMAEAESGGLWDRVFADGEPNMSPLLTVLVLDGLRGTDPRARLPRFAWLRTPVMYQRPDTLAQRQLRLSVQRGAR